MQPVIKFLVLLGLSGVVAAQGVTENLFPPTSAPAGCQQSVSGQFEITVLEHSIVARDDLYLERDGIPAIQKRKDCGQVGTLVVTLTDSIAKDAQMRTGYVASNYQFQFDAPAQAGALYTAGFSLCGNGLMALGNSTQFWKCKSGDFWNLYDRNWAAQCDPVALQAIPCGAGSDSAVGYGGQVVGTDTVTTTIVRPISDGQPQVITTTVPIPMCQIGDGQVQAHSTPCASLPPTPTGSPISQITDGQVQVPPPGTGAITTVAQPPASSAPPPQDTGVPTITAGESTTGGNPTPGSQPSTVPSQVPAGDAAHAHMGAASPLVAAAAVAVAVAIL